MQWIYLIGAILGTVLPLSQFLLFVAANGLDISLLIRQLFQTQGDGFLAKDVLVS